MDMHSVNPNITGSARVEDLRSANPNIILHMCSDSCFGSSVGTVNLAVSGWFAAPQEAYVIPMMIFIRFSRPKSYLDWENG